MQIHHIDGDPANNVLANLAVLCFDCHNETQVHGGFDRKLDADQVILYRDDWHRQVAEARARGQAARGEAELEGVSVKRPAQGAEVGEPADHQPLSTGVVEKILAEELPPQNAQAGEDFADLLEELAYLGVDEASSFRTIVRRHRDWVLSEDSAKVQRIKEWDQQGRRKGVVYPEAAVARVRDLGVFYSHVGLAKAALMREFKYGVRVLVNGEPI